jgi:hypothetical protein
MHENKFEKQVQEKMEELQFAPSDAVWANVDKEINKDEKRRRPVFWLFLFFGILLLGGGYFLTINNKIKVQESKVQEGKEQESKTQGNTRIQENKEQEKTRVQENNVEEKIRENKTQKQTISLYNLDKKNILGNRKIAASSSIKYHKEKLVAGELSDAEKEKSKSPEKYLAEKELDNKVADDKRESVNKAESVNKKEQSGDKRNVADSSAVKKSNVIADNKTVIKDSAADNKITADKKQQKKSSSWKIGFTGGAGISNINENLFKSAYVTNPSFSTVNAATGINAPGNVVYKSSQINPGFSFNAGVFVNKHLSERVSFSAGISYHYYSTTIHTGSSVDSSIYIYPSTAYTATSQVSGYYHNGNSNTYIDHYHFIALPLSLNFQLSKSQKTPLIWEAGGLLSYLINSNALYFDPVTDVYFKNNKLFNKLQLNAATAIMLAVHLNKSELQFGPQLQYGLTGLLNKSTGNPEHIFYGGLKIIFIPQKK